MKKTFKEALLLIAFGVVLFVGLENLNTVANFAVGIFRLITPVFAGLMLAFVLNVPISGMEKLFAEAFKKAKRKPKDSTVTAFCTVATLLIIAAVLALVITITGPEIVSSVKSLYRLIQNRWPTWVEVFRSYNIDISGIAEWFETTDIQNLLEKIASGTGVVLDTVIGAASTTINGVVTACFSVIIAVYILLSKKELHAQISKLLDAYCKPKPRKLLEHIAQLSRETYAKFLSGQCVEAIILGVLMFIFFSIFRLPYAPLVAVVTAVCAFIPYIGAFTACVIGAFLTLLVSPSQVILCIIVYNVVQFVENQFIYPHVVGSSVGLSPLLTLIAALVGGKLLGLVGIIFFIPLTAVIRTLLAEATEKRIGKKNNEPASADE